MRLALARVCTAAVPTLTLLFHPACGPSSEGLPEHVTFTEHVAPIMFERCAPCHRRGEAAPFPLLTYRDVHKRAQQVSQVIRERYMPPWLATGDEREWIGDRRMTDEEIELVRRWVKSGAPEGDPKKMPAPPRWSEGWHLGRPDLVVELPEPYTLAADGFDVFRNFVIPLPVERTRWVRSVELRPGNKRVVHHAIMHIDRTPASRRLDAEDAEPGFAGMEMGSSVPPDGHFLGWTPGRVPFPGREELAWRLDPGTDLVLQLHMLPTGKPEPIRPAVGFHFAEGPSDVTAFVLSLDSQEIDIPAGKADYVVEDSMVLPVPVEVVGLYPHAHYLCKTMDVRATLPGGGHETLIRIDDWDFNWQDEYRYREPLPLPAGTRVSMRYVYDNSSGNERNPTYPPVRVTVGNRSTDEMASLQIQMLLRSAEDRLLIEEAHARHKLSKNPRHFAALNNLGSALVALGRPVEAEEYLRQAIAARPDLDDAHYNLGVALAAQGRFREAIASYREALRSNPALASAENNLGNAFLALGRAETALEHYRNAVRLQPEFDEAHYNLGNALLNVDRAAESVEHYRESLRINPDHGMTYNNLGVALQSLGRTDEALQLFRKALEVEPGLAEARANLEQASGRRDRIDR